MNKDTLIGFLLSLTKDIVWNSLFISDYENRYGIDANIVSDFADGYLDWLCEEFKEEIDDNFSTQKSGAPLRGRPI